MFEYAAQRQEMVRVGRLLYERQLIVAAEGNLSVRLREDLFLVTPAGVCKGHLNEQDLLLVDGDGSAVDQLDSAHSAAEEQEQQPAATRPSSEWPLHREIYQLRPDVRAVCHGHPPWATAFAAAGQALDGCLLPEIIATLGAVPLAPYGTPGTDEVPGSVHDLVGCHDALLLSNHGVVTLGETLREACFRLESVERLAQVTLLARLAGGERRLSEREAVAVQALASGALAGDPELACIPGTESATALPVAARPDRGPTSEPEDLELVAERIAKEILAELRRKS